MNHWIGKAIGQYQIVEEIGRGGMATVYRAFQPQLERWVAIKVLHTTDATSQEFLARFRQEARAIATLRHPNILTIYDYGEQEGLAYIVMEYVPGGTLKAQLSRCPIEWPDAASLIIPVGQALAYAHSQGIVHRDVKPANILLARPDWPMLADFGLVKLVGGQRGITRPGVSIGTPAYFSPEQAAGEEVDQRTDIYSLAVLLYQLLTGRLPFESNSTVEMMLKRLYQDPVPPRDINPRISPVLEATILRGMARDAAARYATMDAMLNDLERVPGATGRPSLATLSAPPTSTTRLGTLSAVSGPHLMVAGTGATITLPPQDEILIGREDPQAAFSPAVDLEPHGGRQAGVSRRHARLLRVGDEWMLEDLKSTNGTFLNGTPLTAGQPVRISTGDIIRCSQVTLIFYED